MNGIDISEQVYKYLDLSVFTWSSVQQDLSFCIWHVTSHSLELNVNEALNKTLLDCVIKTSVHEQIREYDWN